MKKLINIAFVAAIAAGAGTLTGCSDFLDAENKTNIDSDSYFPTEEGLEGLRTYTYSLLKPLLSSTDLYERGTDLYCGVHGENLGELSMYTFTPQTLTISDYYTNLYSFINNANYMIQMAGDNGTVEAEGKFFRCFGYYLLTQQFGSVPYVDWFIQNAERNYPKTPLSELYPTLIAELEGIMNDANLPAEPASADGYGRVSQRAVKALLAKVCLAAGWDLGTTLDNAVNGTYTINDRSYFEKAAQYADAAIAGQPLTMTFEEKWAPENEGNNNETIFSLQYERNGFPGNLSDGGHGLQNNIGGYYGQPNSTGEKYCGRSGMSAKAIYLWGKGDTRFDATFMTTMYNYNGTWGTTGYYAYYNGSNLNSMPIAFRYFPFYVTEAEAEAELAANAAQYVRGSNVNAVYAYIMADPVVMYSFSANGTWTKSTPSYSEACGGLNFPATVKKFDDPQTAQENINTTNGYRDIVVFHLSDMYLTAAEAYLMAGDQTQALARLNSVRDRSNAGHLNSFSDYQYEYTVPANFGDITDLDVILDEKAREEYGESGRWMDLRRTRQLVRYNVAFNPDVTSVTNMSNARGEIKWYRPIPATELANNTAMTDADQNPGY